MKMGYFIKKHKDALQKVRWNTEKLPIAKMVLFLSIL